MLFAIEARKLNTAAVRNKDGTFGFQKHFLYQKVVKSSESSLGVGGKVHNKKNPTRAHANSSGPSPGVPMIAYPQWTDQPTNAKLIADVFHVALRLNSDSKGFVETEQVEKTIEQVMNSGPISEELKKNAAASKAAAREATVDGGSSDRNIQLFVDEVIGFSSRSTF
ncbi:Glycosyltransferase [Quillaja saponaria]|uniref:Glycosyltransferase n=1 Tax=Quillaja saponaria TaxID=32244 RepID=A0AAD7P8M1_QUISA|nr:Glycosyltransferase [Quillaja saponaria]